MGYQIMQLQCPPRCEGWSHFRPHVAIDKFLTSIFKVYLEKFGRNVWYLSKFSGFQKNRGTESGHNSVDFEDTGLKFYTQALFL